MYYFHCILWLVRRAQQAPTPVQIAGVVPILDIEHERVERDGIQKWTKTEFKTIVQSQPRTLVPCTYRRRVRIVIVVLVTPIRKERIRQCYGRHFAAANNIHLPPQGRIQRVPTKTSHVGTCSSIRSVHAVTHIVGTLRLAHAQIRDHRVHARCIEHVRLNADRTADLRCVVVNVQYLHLFSSVKRLVKMQHRRTTRMVHLNVSSKHRTRRYARRNTGPYTVRWIDASQCQRARNVDTIVHRQRKPKLTVRENVGTVHLVERLTRGLDRKRRTSNAVAKIVVREIHDR